jgi:hypothetical protein
MRSSPPGFELYLQFDSFRRDALMNARAADTRRVHDQALANPALSDLSSVSLDSAALGALPTTTSSD